jgi:hypothetical protein
MLIVFVITHDNCNKKVININGLIIYILLKVYFTRWEGGASSKDILCQTNKNLF